MEEATLDLQGHMHFANFLKFKIEFQNLSEIKILVQEIVSLSCTLLSLDTFFPRVLASLLQFSSYLTSDSLSVTIAESPPPSSLSELERSQPSSLLPHALGDLIQPQGLSISYTWTSPKSAFLVSLPLNIPPIQNLHLDI